MSVSVHLAETFARPAEVAMVDDFLAKGYLIAEVEDRPSLDAMRHELVLAACKLLERPPPDDDGKFLDQFHATVPVEKLNGVRLHLYREMNARAWFRPTYFNLARGKIEALVGNELAMQNRVNFSIQMPNDRTSLLDIHADVFSGETPFQIVQWLPLVDVFSTKSMFILPRPKSEDVIARLKDFKTGGMKELYDAVRKDVIWLDIPYGNVLLFCPNFLHGNVTNEEATTRWSMNCRFKGLFTPYVASEKGLGSFYLPITPKPATRLGLAYQQPRGFDD